MAETRGYIQEKTYEREMEVITEFDLWMLNYIEDTGSFYLDAYGVITAADAAYGHEFIVNEMKDAAENLPRKHQSHR